MKADYGFQLATIFDFETHGSNWNEANQAKLSEFKQVDFVKYAYPQYEHKGTITRLSEISAGKYRYLLPFFTTKKTKPSYDIFYQMMKNQADYVTRRLTFEDLNEIVENFSEK